MFGLDRIGVHEVRDGAKVLGVRCLLELEHGVQEAGGGRRRVAEQHPARLGRRSGGLGGPVERLDGGREAQRRGTGDAQADEADLNVEAGAEHRHEREVPLALQSDHVRRGRSVGVADSVPGAALIAAVLADRIRDGRGQLVRHRVEVLASARGGLLGRGEDLAAACRRRCRPCPPRPARRRRGFRLRLLLRGGVGGVEGVGRAVVAGGGHLEVRVEARPEVTPVAGGGAEGHDGDASHRHDVQDDHRDDDRVEQTHEKRHGRRPACLPSTATKRIRWRTTERCASTAFRCSDQMCPPKSDRQAR